MSISSEVRRAGPYSGNGSTTAFAFAFKVFNTSQVLVTRTVSGVDTTLTLTTHYTVSLNANQNTNPGGTVTMLAAPVVGQSLTITSNVANLQPTAIANLGGFYPEVINDSLDRATIQIQQLDERLDRALVIPVSSSGVSTQLPAPSSSKLIGWDSAGTALQNYNNIPVGSTVYQYVHRTIATAGQTAVALPITYTVGAMALSVFVNGLRVEQGSGLDYVETNSSTITFTSGLAAGDLVVVAIHGDIDAAATPPNYTIESIAALRLLTGTTSATQLILLWNHVAGDGGGIFRYDSTDTTTADNSWFVIVDAAGRRWKRQSRGALQTNITLYVNHSSGTATGAGTLASPFSTITRAYAVVRDAIDLAGKNILISVAAGTFSEIIICSGALTGWTDLGSLIVRGDTTTPTNVTNSISTNHPCLAVYENAFVRFEGITFQNASATTSPAVQCYKQAYLELGAVRFGACGFAYAQGADGWIVVNARGSTTATVTLAGNAKIGFISEVGNGGIDLSGATVTFSGSITYTGHPSSAFVNAGEGSYFAAYNTTWSGTFTGRKYYASDFAAAVSQNEIEDIPGSAAGVWSNPIITAPQGRLTLTSATPITVADVTGATTVYYTPYTGDYVAVSVNATNTYEMTTFAEVSLALSATHHATNTNYDLFVIRDTDNSPILCSGPAWTNDTTRSAAISRPNGIWANTASMTVRYGAGANTTKTAAAGEAVYVGTIRTGSAGETEDSNAKRFVWNAYGRVARSMRVLETTNFWTYSTADWRQLNNSAANQLAFVRGWDFDSASATTSVYCNTSSGTVGLGLGIGLDSSTAFNAGSLPAYQDVGTTFSQLHSHYTGFPGLGYHTLRAIERGGANAYFYGDDPASVPMSSGIIGVVAA